MSGSAALASTIPTIEVKYEGQKGRCVPSGIDGQKETQNICSFLGMSSGCFLAFRPFVLKLCFGSCHCFAEFSLEIAVGQPALL